MKKIILVAAIGISMFSNTLSAQQTPFIGQIAFVAFNFAPVGWLECNGQTLTISSNIALFSLLGTTYGGDGISTFALPDMRGRTVVSDGQGAGLSTYTQGQTGGQESVILTTAQIPAHSHSINAVIAEGNDASPTGNLPANTKILDKEYSNLTGNTAMNPNMVNMTGGNQPHENRPPFITLKCIIAVQGLFPTRP